jgi:hypothetical protein
MELAGLEPATSWVRSRLAKLPKMAGLQVFTCNSRAVGRVVLLLDYGRLPAIRPLVGLEWLKWSS